MPTLKGKWYFKDTLDKFDKETISANISFSFTINDSTLNGTLITVSSTDLASYLYYFINTTIPVYIDGTWVDQAYRSIEITSPTEVSEEFYNWFTQNAVDLQPTGTWRFNKTLKLPDHSIYTNYGPNAPYYTTCGYSNGVTIFEIGADSGNFYYNTGTSNVDSALLELYHNNSWNVYDTNTEVYRNIEFVSGITLDPEFALWFFENAHSMELKLYSECYIAETADKIRECANDNTLTFKVSDLADGVQLAYDAGYSKGSSENSLDLEALGALCDWDMTSDSTSQLLITIMNRHPSYYLNCELEDTCGNPIYALPSGWEYGDSYEGNEEIGECEVTLIISPNSSASFFATTSLGTLQSGEEIRLKNMRWTENE